MKHLVEVQCLTDFVTVSFYDLLLFENVLPIPKFSISYCNLIGLCDLLDFVTVLHLYQGSHRIRYHLYGCTVYLPSTKSYKVGFFSIVGRRWRPSQNWSWHSWPLYVWPKCSRQRLTPVESHHLHAVLAMVTPIILLFHRTVRICHKVISSKINESFWPPQIGASG